MRWVARWAVVVRCGGRGEGYRQGWRWERAERRAGFERADWRAGDLWI